MGPSPLVLAHHSILFSLSFFPGLPSECERILSRSDGDCPVPTDGQLVPLPTARLPQGPGVSLVVISPVGWFRALCLHILLPLTSGSKTKPLSSLPYPGLTHLEG